MSDETKSLEIKITTPYDGTGAQAAAADVNKIAGASGNAAPEIKNLGKKAKKSKEEFRLFNEEGAEMRRIIQELNVISPSLGEAFRLMRSPIGGTLAAAIGLFVELKAYIEETNKALDEMGQTAANADFLSGIEDKIKVFGDAAASAQGYADKLAEIASGEQTINDKLKDQRALDEAIERAQAELVSAQKGLAIAKIQEAEDSGKMTPGQAAQARADVEKKAIADEEAAREAAQDRKLADDQAALLRAQAQAADLAATTDAALDKETKDKAHLAGLTADFGDPKKVSAQQADAQKKIDEANAVIDHINTYGFASVFSTVQDTNEKLKEAQKTVRQGKERMQMIRDGVDEFNAANDPAKAKREQDATAYAASQEFKNAQDITDLTKAIADLTATIAATRPIEQQTAAVKSQTIDADTQAKDETQIKRDVEEITKTAHDTKATPQDTRDALNAVKDAMALLSDHKELWTFLVAQGNTIAKVQQDIAQLKQSAARLKNTMNMPQ